MQQTALKNLLHPKMGAKSQEAAHAHTPASSPTHTTHGWRGKQSEGEMSPVPLSLTDEQTLSTKEANCF